LKKYITYGDIRRDTNTALTRGTMRGNYITRSSPICYPPHYRGNSKIYQDRCKKINFLFDHFGYNITSTEHKCYRKTIIGYRPTRVRPVSRGVKGAVLPRKIRVPPPVLVLQFNSTLGCINIFIDTYLVKTQSCILSVSLNVR